MQHYPNILQCYSAVVGETLGAWNGAWDPPPAMADLDPGDLRILIVNEDMRSADSLKRVLRDLGYRMTHTAYSGHRALDLVETFCPSVALLDLDLPDMSGFQLARKLLTHRHQHVRNLCLLAVAEESSSGEADRARAAGFVGCLRKPVPRFELDRLMRTLER